ncbi:helix-turn-helix domain-containing protein [Fictibacillus terranigra]|uniref:Helix-turn-helix transcriptional regulator n=1 Tax=Fictibacillus terranigra TaxID=3058424 RepID=A0ABT8E4R7_9BACL|nr:helix-turn-helix transcriptional regulator [Fictibacillus sp. CENA-BCM004]MDN4072900.1 helix-turn-helix transcriptional regulator [Fictibacillus sp. CENA-BCM004]
MKSIDLAFIKTRRIELRITMQHMAVILGFKNASTYMKYENGVYTLKAVHLPLIAKELHCELASLFFEHNFAKTAK